MSSQKSLGKYRAKKQLMTRTGKPDLKLAQSFQDEETLFQEMAYLGLTKDEIREIMAGNYNPFSTVDFRGDPGKDLLRICRNPEMWPFFCKVAFNIDLLPFQAVFLETLFNHSFPLMIACRGGSKTFTIALYVMLMMTLFQETKVVMVGTGFRQSRLIFEYMEKTFHGSPILKDLIGDYPATPIQKYNDRWTMRIGRAEANALPLGTDGAKVRGFRANIIIADEFQSQNPVVYNEVISGFGSTSASPAIKAKEAAKRQYLIQEDRWKEEHQENFEKGQRGNQQIIVGTADYEFGHFCQLFKKYRNIINSKGDATILSPYKDEEGNLPDWKKYAIIRLPYDLFPEGFMDKDNIQRQKMMLPKSLFDNEYKAKFGKDSEGFFPMSIIVHCTSNEDDPIVMGDGAVLFSPVLRGNPNSHYIYGIDPAAEQDNFALVILECHKDHRRVVYCWTTNRDEFKKKAAKGLIKEHDYFSYCSKKVRELMRVFPCDIIAMDAQGGGNMIYEAWQDPEKMAPDEVAILQVPKEHVLSFGDDEGDNLKSGLHILQMCQFGNYDWLYDANMGLKKDMEDKLLIFPYIDPIALAVAFEKDQENKVYEGENAAFKHDTLEQCVLEIEALKKELITIQMMPTPANNRYRWDTAEVKIGAKKSRLRKDRYSALLLANAAARKIHRFDAPKMELPKGGYVGSFGKNDGMKMWGVAPAWFLEQSKGTPWG